MTTESATPESGALSVEQAIATLEAPETVEQQAPEAQAAPEPEEKPEGETSTPDEPADEAENLADAEAEGDAEPEAENLPDPPLYWSPEGKAKWAVLSPEARAEILAQEGPRETAVAKAKAEAAEISQRAQADIGKVQQLADRLAQQIPGWLQAFKDRDAQFAERWGTEPPDWLAYAQQNGIETKDWAKAQYEAEKDALSSAKEKLGQALEAKQIADAQAHQSFLQAEFAKLPEVEPDLADPAKGAARRKAAVEHAVKRGVPADAIPHMSAVELSIVYDAMQWREAQAKHKAAPKPIPRPTPTTTPLTRGGASPGPVNPQQKLAATIARRFAKSKSIDDAVAYLEAKD